MSNPTNKTMELIHYGAEAFDPLRFKPVDNSQWIKPSAPVDGIDPRTGKPFNGKSNAGFWASPVSSCWGWKDWCLSEDFNCERLAKSFLVRITGNILTINSIADLDLLTWHRAFITSGGAGIEGISFKKMKEEGIDAIFLTERGERETRYNHPRTLYGWDCESVLVLNPEIIEPIEQATVAKPQVRRRAINIHRIA